MLGWPNASGRAEFELRNIAPKLLLKGPRSECSLSRSGMRHFATLRRRQDVKSARSISLTVTVVASMEIAPISSQTSLCGLWTTRKGILSARKMVLALNLSSPEIGRSPSGWGETPLRQRRSILFGQVGGSACWNKGVGRRPKWDVRVRNGRDRSDHLQRRPGSVRLNRGPMVRISS